MKCRTNAEFADYVLKTENQWKKGNKTPMNIDDGEPLWSNQYCNGWYMYYGPDQVRDMTAEEITAYKEEQRQKRNAAKARRKEKQEKNNQEMIEEEVRYKVSMAREQITDEQQQIHRTLAYDLMKRAAKQSSIPCNNPSGIIVFDTATTGLDPDQGEILQISIIDGNGNVLIDEYVKPYWTEQWEDAQEINSISPKMVADARYPHELIPKVKGIFESAKLCIAYNIPFDVGMMEKWGMQLESMTCEWYDVMTVFSVIYGEWSDYYGAYKWKKLRSCAEYFGYMPDGDYHNSLEDVKATLYCYDQIQELDEGWAKSKYQRGVTVEKKQEVQHSDPMAAMYK
jgi:DNA polymerase-3 subunit epsilon